MLCLVRKGKRMLVRPSVYKAFFINHGWKLLAIGSSDTIYEIERAFIIGN